MSGWSFAKDTAVGGRFQLVITKYGPAGRAVDVTLLRGAPTQLENYSSGDPFGDSTAVFSFPAITPFDDLEAGDLGQWLGYYSDVDLFWVPGLPASSLGYDGEPLVISALSNQPDLITPAVLRNSSGDSLGDNRIKVWEGYLASMDFSASATSANLQIQCQGALFQADRYLMKPFFPSQSWPLEMLIALAFDRKRKPHLRTHTLITAWPHGWKLKYPKYTGSTVYTPVGKPGNLWSGYSSRSTGSWDHAMTGFVQDLLTVMITDKRTGVAIGNQWTVQHSRQGIASPAGRQPVLTVRDRFRPPDFSIWLGTPGVDVELSGDSTQSENIIYGDGTDSDGTVWRNAVISASGRYTDYLPVAASRSVYPPSGDGFDPHGFASEAYTKFGDGFSQPEAATVAAQQLGRDEHPGWSGTITLRTDVLSESVVGSPLTTSGGPIGDPLGPYPAGEILPRWLIRAGMTVLLKGFLGSGETGVPLHVSAVQVSPMEGTVALTVDTRYRDLLTVDEAMSRTRDPLTPVKMLQVNKTSVLIDDLRAPWDYSAGAGYIPKLSLGFHKNKPTSELFPYDTWRRKHPPLNYGHYYIKVNAGAPTTKARWTQKAVPVLTGEKGTISHTEFSVCDKFGHPLKIPFHVSFYKVNVTPSAMPRKGANYSPYQNGAFEQVSSATGTQIFKFFSPDDSLIIGWGNQSDHVMNRAGFWPGRESHHDPATGLLVDDASWGYDNDFKAFFVAPNRPGRRPVAADISIYVMIYAEYHEPVYFMGRLWRQNPGGDK